MNEIRIEKSASLKPKPDASQLEFGKLFTDHMFLLDYSEELGWHDPRIVPYGPLTLDPASMILHYGQAVFEGLKAFRTSDNRILLFRPNKNAERLNVSNERLSIPEMDEAAFVEYVKALIAIDRDWVPSLEGTSLYIRPFIIATEPCLGVRAAKQYLFAIIMSPVGAYYKEGIHPVKINVENKYVRAVRGGTGFAKTAGNYASSIKAQEEAKHDGFSQVLWLDGKEHAYIEEVGSMNIFFKIGGEIVTPELNGSILAGVTRDSVIGLLKSWGYPVTERKISIEEIRRASEEGKLEEAFGTGTAAVISPVGQLHWEEHTMTINGGETGEIARRLYDTITGIQSGKLADSQGWNVVVE
ncbi:branched-chain amino acid aminotransferase [Paenibacillus hemerocallicola]|uniref:Branched-chain-amino-acid aminotransferase n=1 Tax=Paenibacillus hemerocallicola TaxID=1172614 RepID=A0A5C4TG97_9BACL|nr:branched-chain amino acid aminotransferase [Paenibacillus hemerocallicola]TNJ67597.1 branched-chain amino acid aminotransferase [Paenibacillus hemerocallicola]